MELYERKSIAIFSALRMAKLEEDLMKKQIQKISKALLTAQLNGGLARFDRSMRSERFAQALKTVDLIAVHQGDQWGERG